MPDLAAFLSACYDRDQALASAAAKTDGARWVERSGRVFKQDSNDNAAVAVADWDGDLGPTGEHIARHDPDRTLRRVGAGRARLRRHARVDDPIHGAHCRWCSAPAAGVWQEWPCPDLRDDAAVYEGEAGYDANWTP